MVIPNLTPHLQFWADSTPASQQKIMKIHRDHSAAAQNTTLKSAQALDNSQRVFNGRPTALTGPCLSIYHPIFQTFMQEYKSPVYPHQIDPLDYAHAKLFVCSSVEYFKDEDARFDAIKPSLQYFFGETFQFQGRMNSDERYWVPNGHAPVTCGLYKSSEPGYRWMVACVNELKNGIGVGNSDPVEQGQQVYVLVCTSSNGAHLGISECYAF
jgi:hypothetical protein